MNEENKTRGEIIAEKLEKEADEMLKQYEASQKGPEDEAEEIATPEQESEETPEENAEIVETSPEQPQDTEESSQAEEVETVEEEPLEEPVQQSNELTAEQWQERYKNAQAMMTKSTQGRAEDKKAFDDKVISLESRIRELEAMPNTPAVQAEMNEVEVDLSEIKKDYPELVDPLQQYVDTSMSKVLSKLQQAEAKLEQVAKAESDAKHFGEIRKAHPDYEVVATSDDFSVWLERQTGMWRSVAEHGEPADVISLLNKYKSDIGFDATPVSKEDLVEKAKQSAEPNLPKARKQKLGNSKKIWTASEIGRLTDKQYLKHESEIDRAYAEGRVRLK